MNIKTKFNIGDKVCTIDKNTMKLRKFEIGIISVYVNKDNTPDVNYRAKEDGYSGEMYDEDKCFTNENELMQFVTSAPVEK